MFDLLVNTLPVAPLLVPMDITIDSNTSGLPGISQLRTIVGAVMTIGLILSVLTLIVSAIVWGFGANSSTPHLASRGKIGVLVSCGAAVICGVFVMLIFFCLQLITGLVRRDPTALARAALGLAKSVLGSFVVITLTALMLEVVDQLCLGIVQATGETTESMGDKITILAGGLAGINIAAPGVGAIITIFLAGVAITSAAIVWLSLLVRKALLLVAVVFAPLAFSGASWDAARGWEVFAGMLHHEFDRLEREQDRLMQAHYAAATTPTDGCATKPSSPRSTPTTNNCARGSRNRSPPSSARARPSATRERNPYRNTTTLRMSRVPVRHLGWSIGDSNP